MVNGETAVLGLIGSPVSHSLSPYIHNMLAKEMGQNVVYAAFDVAEDDLETAIRGAFALGIRGLNVTYPHKVGAAKLAAFLEHRAAQVEAVNTLKYTQNGYIGYNTDVFGVKRAFEHHGVDIAGKTAVIAGAGAAARSAAFALAQMGCQKVTVVNRTKKNAEMLAFSLEKYYNINVESCAISELPSLSGFAYVHAAARDAVFPHPNFDSYDVFFDMNYANSSSLLQDAESLGILTVSSTLMLVYQAIAAFEIFCDVKIPQITIDKVMEDMGG